MRARGSIIARSLSRVLVVSLVYLVMMSFILYREASTTLTHLRDEVLSEHALQLGSYLERDKLGRLVLDMPRDEKALYEKSEKRDQYDVRDRSGRVIFRSPNIFDARLPATWPPEGSFQSFTFRDSSGFVYYGKATTHVVDGKPYLIQILWDEDVANEASKKLLHVFLSHIAMLGIPLLFLLSCTLVFTINRELEPVIRAARQADIISVSAPGMRLDENELPSEIRPLATSVNRALDRLEQAIRAQKSLTAHAAHELRTPLAVLRAHVYLMKDDAVAQVFKEDLDAMSRLVSQLLSAARLELTDELPRERMDLAAVVREVCAKLWPMMVDAGLRFEVSGVDAPVWIRGNRDAIYECLSNLLENALRHVPSGSRVLVEERGGRISVTDNGPGIPNAAKEKIFEHSWRVDSRIRTGSGIGLYIVKRTMDLHGGSVRVEDAPGGGSVFILTFPET